eukprot:5490199-Amphidinium_carterae.1
MASASSLDRVEGLFLTPPSVPTITQAIVDRPSHFMGTPRGNPHWIERLTTIPEPVAHAQQTHHNQTTPVTRTAHIHKELQACEESQSSKVLRYRFYANFVAVSYTHLRAHETEADL